MKLNRSIEAWDKCDAGAMSQMSEAAIKYAFADAKQDIKRMAAIQAQLVAALQDAIKELNAYSEADSGESFNNPAMNDALAAAGAQP